MITSSKIKTNWNLAPLLKDESDETIDKNLEQVKKANYAFINKWQDRQDYLTSPAILKEALDEFEYLNSGFNVEGSAGFYFSLKSSIETDNPVVKAKFNKINDLNVKIANDIQFFTHRLAKIPQADQVKLLESPLLKDYKHFLERLFLEAKYLLAEDQEKILTVKIKTSYYNWISMLTTLLAKEEALVIDDDGQKRKKAFSEITDLVSSKHKKTRDSAAKELNKIFYKHIDVAENELNSVLQHKKTEDELRNINRPDITSHLDDDMETEVVDTLLTTVSTRFDIARDYYKLKAALFKVDKLEYHERNVAYGDLDKKYSFEDALHVVYKTFDSIDSEFSAILQRYVENGQLDAYPKKGKSDGAYCAPYLKSLPCYVFLNHNDRLRDVLTLAHEMGHAIHDEFTKKAQNSLNTDAGLAAAEVASTFMEDFVLGELLTEADDELKLSLMMMKLNSDVNTIVRQVACYRFEQELHSSLREQGYLSKEVIGDMFSKHMSAYMGDYVSQSKGSENWWIYWDHIRRYFYVYTYASGLLISKSLQFNVKKDRAYLDKVKYFLRAGSSESPRETFSKIGIDISKPEFWNQGLDEVANLLKTTENLAKKLGKV